MKQLFCRFPLWLEYSGLPERLNAAGGPGVWAVFKKLVELDCAANPMAPGTVEAALTDLGRSTGIAVERLPGLIEKLRRQRLVRCFIPDEPCEPGLFEFLTPLRTPVSAEEIRREHAAVFRSAPFFRYVDVVKDVDPDDPVLKKVVDLYFQCLGLSINPIALDQLRLLRDRFPLGRIQRVMEQARRHDIHSLSWVARQLFREQSRMAGGSQPPGGTGAGGRKRRKTPGGRTRASEG
ncbi:MAG: hypothetical protein Kow0059_06470 [Candidatus Sumerlaeia bacterium]